MDKTITLAESLIISLTSIIVVFAVLVLIAGCINLMTKLVASDSSKDKGNKKTVELENIIDNNDELELIAVISAAIACRLGLKICDVNINSIKHKSC